MSAPHTDSPDNPLSFQRLIVPIVAHAGLIVTTAVVTAALVGAFILTRPRKFEAPLSFSTFQSSRVSALPGGLSAALFAGATGAGLQPTPALLSRLAGSDNVRASVARTVVPGRGDRTVADLAMERDTHQLPDMTVIEAIGKIVATTTDRETGLVTVSTTSSDSSLARFVTQRVVAEVTTAFQRAVKTQAGDTKSSLSQRFDSASIRLRNAERATQEFVSRNRNIPQYSPVSLEADRLNRELTLAQTLYSQVVTEREAAKQKELEDTPAVVIVDPLPRELKRLSRQLVMRTAIAFVVAFGLVAAICLLRDMWRPPRNSTLTPNERLIRALHDNRFLRWTVAHLVIEQPATAQAQNEFGTAARR